MRLPETHFIVVTGGVLSGLGKGVITASIGALLKMQGYRVSAVKMDPYINLDAGTMRPTEHGEVFVTQDGGETDQDIGTYERFLGIDIPRSHSITTGQVYHAVIERERNLEYDGRCVEVIPHIPQEIQRRIDGIAREEGVDFLLLEIGGTIGDYQSVLFLEAVREMRYRHRKIMFIHVAYLPTPSSLGEMKTKPAQHSVRELLSAGIQPDMIIGRGEFALDEVRREKLSLFCNVSKDAVLSSPDCASIYQVPLVLEQQGIIKAIFSKFGLVQKPYGADMEQWKSRVHALMEPMASVKIGIVGKYFDTGDFSLPDSYVSVIEAIRHAGAVTGVRAEIVWLDSKRYEKNPSLLQEIVGLDGVIVPGGFGSRGVEGKISAIRVCREQGIPFLGLCYGMQLAVVEYARNVLGLQGAHTTEIDPKTLYPVVMVLPDQQKVIAQKRFGATMRLGAYEAHVRAGSRVAQMYGSEVVSERHRHRYEVNPQYLHKLESAGLSISGTSPDGSLAEFVEISGHPFFVGTQAHPELKSQVLRPAPLFVGFMSAACKRSSAHDVASSVSGMAVKNTP